MDKKWNLQDIKPAGERKPKRSVESPARKTEVTEQPTKKPVRKSNNTANNGKSSKVWLFAAVGVAIVLLGFVVNMLLGGAEVVVEPRFREVTVNSEFTAYKTPQVGDLPYELLTLEAEGQREVAASGQEEASEQATGEVTIYKTTAGSERLIKNTRLESPEGLIFHITESVVVPGATEGADGETIPGSVKASVFADQTGEEYNLEPTKFTVPGFKEGGYDSLYEAIYAENSVAIAGGFEGTRFIIDEGELANAQDSLHAELRDALLTRLPEEKPAGFVVFDNAVTFDYQSMPAVENGENNATIKEKAILQVPIFAAEDFASYIAGATVPGYEKEPVRIDDYGQLQFEYSSTTVSVSSIASLDQVSFDLAGKATLVWTFDQENLKADLAGKNRTAIVNILAAYPAIENTKIITRPFWKRSLPDEPSDIKITEQIGDKNEE